MREQRPSEIPDNSESGVTRAPGNVSGGGRALRARKATGPRTIGGKQRSARNAIKHGIYSSVVLLEGESRSELNSLLIGLEEYFHPKGTLEEILVNKLATLFWRYRRLLIAEAAEIKAGIRFPHRNKSDKSAPVVNLIVSYVNRDEDDRQLI